ncbi:MAG: imidazole glycerol phosphate synthase subunit HisH [Gammaproteobacteria bacterium]|nr:imidazole glycerol phosphate synthase subunit HisH [Gammaproteobacteria bacterium]
MSSVVVIDYGMGNIRSVAKALEHVGADEVTVSHDPETILRADRVVLPGVGALHACMSELHRLELEDVLSQCTRDRPFLGICLGMQALLDFSEEGGRTPGLALVPGEVRHFAGRIDDPALKVPHMGWNKVRQVRSHPLWEGIPDESRFYFVHSYYVAPSDPSVSVGETEYGLTFTSALAKGSAFAVQFHPEKSQQVGLTLLGNFLRWQGD